MADAKDMEALELHCQPADGQGLFLLGKGGKFFEKMACLVILEINKQKQVTL